MRVFLFGTAKVIAAVGFGCLLGQVALPNPQAETVRAMQIVDADGRVRITLGMNNGEPGIWLLDEQGTTRAALGQLGDGSAFSMTTRDGKLALHFSLRNDGDARLSLSETPLGRAGIKKARFMVHLDPARASSTLGLWSRTDTGIVATAGGAQSHVVLNPKPNANASVHVYVPGQGQPNIELFDSQGALLRSIP